ncbi:hypothetical protein LXA43DRAFT_1042976 [Ganoderma leucocontextum]|nr:hypothetical protein LXA43DRAFT_1042976 [Ganoderma leucocontextum]
MNGPACQVILGPPDFETRYGTILVVLATTVMTCYAFFTTFQRYRLIPAWSSLFWARNPSQYLSMSLYAPCDAFSSVTKIPTCDDDIAPAGKGSCLMAFHDLTDPIVEPQASLVESECCVPDDFALSEPGLTSVRPRAHLNSETNVSEPARHKTEYDNGVKLPHLDDVVLDPPVAVHVEVDLDLSPPDSVEELRLVEIQETAYPTSQHMSDGSYDCQPGDDSDEPFSGLVVDGTSPAQTLSPADTKDSIYLETPFLLNAGTNSSIHGQATLGAEPSSEDDRIAVPPITMGGVLHEPVLRPSPSSKPDFTNDDASSYIMRSALLVLVPAGRADDGCQSSAETETEPEPEDGWTAVDRDESCVTPRPSSPTDPLSATMEVPEVIGESDLTDSAVLLTQSQYASISAMILPPIAANDGDLPPPTSLMSSGSARPRAHTLDRPDWAVAPPEEQGDEARRERAQRRHSGDSPDWAVAPDDTSGVASFAKKKGGGSDPGSGARKKSRRAWASR